MQPEKKLQVPLLREAAEVETFGQPFSVDCVNWPADFPFAPSCAGHIGHTSDALVVNFRVSGPDMSITAHPSARKRSPASGASAG